MIRSGRTESSHNQPFYAAIGVDLNGRRDVLGSWAGKGGGESAKFWMNVLADLKNRGVGGVFFVVCDGLKGLPDSVNAVFPLAIVQACVIHYADPRVMPMWSWASLRDRGCGLRWSA